MVTPTKRSEFERNMYILNEEIRNNTHVIFPDIKIIRSLMDVKGVPNRRINFLTINEMVRLKANMMANKPIFWQKHKERKGE